MAEYKFPCQVSTTSASTNTATTTNSITITTTTTQQKNTNVNATSSSAVVSSTVGNLKEKITTLFFDLDNTLIPTRTGDSKACRKLTEVLEAQFGFTKEDSTNSTQAFLKAFRRCPDNSQTSLDSWRTYLWRETLPSRHKHLAEQIYARWLQLRYRALALPADYVNLLRAFRERGYRLALITNGPSNAQWEKVRKLNVSTYFDCVLVSSDLPWEKPNPNIFYAACNFLGVKPAECAMIGDKLETDIKGGHLAGLGVTFWIPLTPVETNDLTDVIYTPDFVLRNVLELCKYFALGNVVASTSGNSATAIAPTTVAHTQQQTLKGRRSSQPFSCSGTTSTCKQSDNYHFQQFSYHQQHHYNQLQQLQQQKKQQQQYQQQSQRRGGSLPAFECMNSSETENSSDSLFY